MTHVVQQNYFNVNSDMSDLLNFELENDSHFHPNLGGITRGGMANHYPMTIMSMYNLGANDSQIQSFKRHWPRNRALINQDLHLLDNGELTSENWHDYLGQSDKLKEFRRIFIGLFIERDIIEVITSLLKKMQNGLPMGLLHPLIRLSFAAMHGDTGLLADSLAYMAIRYRDVYQVRHFPKAENPNLADKSASGNWLVIYQLSQKKLLQDHLYNSMYGGSIHICEQLCASTYVHKLALGGSFKVNANCLDASVRQICKSSVKLYLFEPKLTTLHAVTGCQALAELTQRYAITCGQRNVFASLWQRIWVWLTALYIEKNCPPLTNLPDKITSTSADSWEQLSAKALQTNEVHVIKMLFSCKWLFEQVAEDPLFHQAARKTLDRT